ncbi:hypothetical protein [Candidatus Phytoplasma sp. AldY-WA1]|uniref:hypothetical protein n=1 Tax=Candidatus Phytoplasma sp. AldY-WA1 TaxID=2852100 RepID=UPI00254B83F2|nr:hypothetical protein [Candidatus Phytoplasma sp. AldY-WA1]
MNIFYNSKKYNELLKKFQTEFEEYKIKLKSLKESKANVEEALIEELNKELEIIIDKQLECLIENDFFDEEHKEFLKETIENI